MILKIQGWKAVYIHGDGNVGIQGNGINRCNSRILHPFRDLRLNYNGAVREIFLNIIMMIPFGFLYPIIKKTGIIKTVTMALLVSLIIECTQLLSSFWGGLASRSFDVTDLVTNTFGSLVGYLSFRILKPIIFKKLNEQ